MSLPKVIQTPIVEAGGILQDTMTTDFVSDAQAILGGVLAQNIQPKTLQRYHISATDGPVAGYHFAEQHVSTGGYNNVDWAVLNHGSVTSEVTFTTAIVPAAGWVIRAHMFAHVNGITISGTTADIGEDMYYFRLVAETSTGSTVIPGGSWGTSIAVRNDASTLTTDTPIDTKVTDVKNFYKYRHVDISQVWILESGSVPANIKKLRWEFKIPGGHHTINIKEFESTFYVYKG